MELGQLSNLHQVYLYNNQLTGSIPVELGQLSNLTQLRLSDNELTGAIPAELANLTNLEELWLNNNQLIGLIPHQLAQLSNLRALSLVDNQFTPCVPAALRAIASNDLSELSLPDCPVVTITPGPSAVVEGTAASFTVTRIGTALTAPLTVSVTVSESGTVISGTAPSSVVILTGQTSATLTIPTVDDTVGEADSVITVTITEDSSYSLDSDSSATQVTVTDDDRPTVTIAANGSPVDEGANASFTLTRTGDTTASLVVAVGVAESGATITGTPPASVTIPAGQASATLTVTTEDDTNAESDSVLTATLASGVLYNVGDTSAASVSAAVTVRDDDPLVSFMAPDAITEGENAVFTFERVGGVSHELEVSVSVLPTGDFLSGTAPTLVTFAAGSTTAELSIPTVDDSTPEADGSIAVLLRQGVDYNVTGTLLQQVSVQDNDRSTITIAVVSSTVEEGNAAVFRVTRTGGTTTEALTVAVTVSETGKMINGTAPTSLTIAANQTSADLSVLTLEDSVDEVDSVITASLSGASTYDLGTTASAAVTVTDDDLPALTITFDDTSPIEEGTTASFTVTRTGVTSEALTINVSVLETGNMIDGTPPTTLVFAANEATADLDIDTDDDSVDEPDSTIYVGVTLPNERRSRTPPDLVSVVVTDND